MWKFLLHPEVFLGALFILQLLSFSRARHSAYCFASFVALLYGLLLPYQSLTGSFPLLDLQYSPLRQIFFVIIAGLGLIVGLYSITYMKKDPDRSRFFGLLGLFQWSCLLVVLANHAIMLVIAWELTSFTSFLLIGFHVDSPKAQRGAFQALLITGLGGLALLGAVVLMGEKIHNYHISEMLSQSSLILKSPQIILISVLMLIAVMTKSAQIPFHFWLPDAMSAPTPVSAYLHSATLVKLGVFLAALFWPLFHQLIFWHVVLSGIGLLTFAWGAIIAIFQRDLKAGLAYTTLSQLGLILMLFAQRNKLAFAAALIVMIAHALYKSCLFLIVGVVADGTKTQDLRELGGFGKSAPVLWFSTVLVAASMAAIPPLFGFFGKEMAIGLLFAHFPSQAAKNYSWACFVLGAVFTFIFAAIFALKPFLQSFACHKKNHDIKFSSGMMAIIAPLSFLSLVFGLIPNPLISQIQKIFPDLELELSLPLTHHWNEKLSVSAVILFLSAVISFLLLRSEDFWKKDWPKSFHLISLGRAFKAVFFDRLVSACSIFTHWFEKFIFKNGLAIILIFLCFLPMPFLSIFHWPDKYIFQFSYFEFTATLGAVAILALVLYCYRSSLVQIFLLGAVGYLVAFSFAIFGAPDLVLTQVIIESTSLILLVLAWLNSRSAEINDRSLSSAKPLAWISSSVSAFILIGSFFSVEGPRFTKLSSLYFFENAKALAGGTNLVNVVIVDFRGLDTLGEISVLGLAYFGALALSRRLSDFPETISPLSLATDWVKKVSQIFIPGLILFGLFYLTRGHHMPGGGFIGGLLFALALFVRLIIFGKKTNALGFCAFGLGFAYFSAILPILFNLQFFQSFHTPLAPSSLFFDIGVFFTVGGSLSGLLEVLLKLRSMLWREKKTHV